MTAGARYHFDNGRSIPGASVSDAAIGSRPIRYSIDGRVVEPDATTDAFLEPVQRLVQNVEAEGERALNELARLMNSGLNPYDTSVPEDCPIAVRGFLFFKNADYLARVDTYSEGKEVRPCAVFQRQGDNLSQHLSVSQSVLRLGGEVRVQTVDKQLLGLTISPGTKDGQRFRLAGQGMPQLGEPDHRGDLYVTVKARMPGEREADSKLTDTSWDKDDTFAMLFFAVLFLAGIGAGFLLFWLILD